MARVLRVFIPKDLGGGFITLESKNCSEEFSTKRIKSLALKKILKKKLQTNKCGKVFLEAEAFRMRILAGGQIYDESEKQHGEDLGDDELLATLETTTYLTLGLYRKVEEKKTIELTFSGIETCHGLGEYIVSLEGQSTVTVGDRSKLSQWTISLKHENQENRYVFLRDYQGRYLTADYKGSVYVHALKGSWAEWLIEDDTYLLNKHGKYLACDLRGNLSCDGKGQWGKFTFCRTILEGNLKKKSSNTIGRQWLQRYFRLANNTLQYWNSKEQALASLVEQPVYGRRTSQNSMSRKNIRSRSSSYGKCLTVSPLTPRNLSPRNQGNFSPRNRFGPNSPRNSKKIKKMWNTADIQSIVKENGDRHRFMIKFKPGIPALILEASSDHERDIWSKALKGEGQQILPENFGCSTKQAEINRKLSIELPSKLNYWLTDLDSQVRITKEDLECLEPIQQAEFMRKQKKREKSITDRKVEQRKIRKAQLLEKDNEFSNGTRELQDILLQIRNIKNKVQGTKKVRRESEAVRELLAINAKVDKEKKKIRELRQQDLELAREVSNMYQEKFQNLQRKEREFEKEKENQKKLIKEKEELAASEAEADRIDKQIEYQSKVLNGRIEEYNNTCKLLNKRVTKEQGKYRAWKKEFASKKQKLEDRKKKTNREREGNQDASKKSNTPTIATFTPTFTSTSISTTNA